ncbi:MAG TPA: HdeD family acid-resistance protein [Streptosporangiaceae bacterium]|nr:HdeD family acid-resistance protein [Streptosporangiaceae bacterium]
MTTWHDRPTPPYPRSSEEKEQRSADEPRSGENIYGTIANSGWLGLTPWQALISAGAVAFVLGLIVLVWPGATLLVVALLFGCYLVLSGVMSLIEGLSDRHADSAMRIAYIVLGVLGVMLGLFCLRRIDVTVVLLAFLLSAFWIMRGVLDLASASRDVAGRGLRVFTGVLSLIAGVLVLFWPGITLTVLLTFAGCWLLIYGIMLATLGLGLRRAVRRAA